MTLRYIIQLPYDPDIDGDIPAMIGDLAKKDQDARGFIGPYFRKIVVALSDGAELKKPRKRKPPR